MSHSARPGAHHLFFLSPAALDNEERVNELLLPIGAPAWLTPGQGGERRHDGAHVLAVDDHVAECRFHTPQGEHQIAINAVLPLDAFNHGSMLARTFFARNDTP